MLYKLFKRTTDQGLPCLTMFSLYGYLSKSNIDLVGQVLLSIGVRRNMIENRVESAYQEATMDRLEGCIGERKGF